MRMRHKKWSMPELLGSGYYVEEPEALRGKWKEAFARSQPLHLELGCGKGVFTAAIAASHPEINYLAIDISPDVLGVAEQDIDKEVEAAGRPPKIFFWPFTTLKGLTKSWRRGIRWIGSTLISAILGPRQSIISAG